MESEKKMRLVVGDYICKQCGSKVIGGDHSEEECSQIRWQLSALQEVNIRY